MSDYERLVDADRHLERAKKLIQGKNPGLVRILWSLAHGLIASGEFQSAQIWESWLSKNGLYRIRGER
ncbi:MAG: hypothetical protein LBN10_05220 [Propionibacteriaceae bacterium]|jgi:hypothetical protein|nr:hypothetical protein [Propionibacteriaceae bacterium]